MLCGQTVLGSTMRQGSCSRIVHCIRLNVARLRPMAAHCRAARFAQPRYIKPSAITGAKKSNTGSSSFPAVMSTIVTLFPCRRIARQDANWDRDCCNCATFSPVTATPWCL